MKKEFDNYEEANAFYLSIEDDYECVSTQTNTPKLGMFTVFYGENPANTWESFIAGIARNEKNRQHEKSCKRQKEIEGFARQNVAKTLAKQKGLTGRDAEMFYWGFIGESAKVVNPKKEGKEEIFRAGRNAWGDNEAQRAYRIEIVQVAARTKPLENWTSAYAVINPEQD